MKQQRASKRYTQKYLIIKHEITTKNEESKSNAK